MLVVGVLVLFLAIVIVVRLVLATIVRSRSSRLYLVLLVVVRRAHYEMSIGTEYTDVRISPEAHGENRKKSEEEKKQGRKESLAYSAGHQTNNAISQSG